MRIASAISVFVVSSLLIFGGERIVLGDCQAEKQYTTAADFSNEFSVNVNTNGADELVVNADPAPLPYVWVAASSRGTIVRIDTDTGEIMGEYRSAPEGRELDPSRTTVDLFKNEKNEGQSPISGEERGTVTHFCDRKLVTVPGCPNW